MLQLFGSGLALHALKGINKCGQQILAIAQQHDIKKWCKGLGIGSEYGSATKNDWMVVGARVAPDRDALLFQQIEQDWSVEFPAERKPKQVAVPVGWIPLISEQPAHVDVGPHRQGGPDDLITEAGDAHGVGAGKGQHRAQGSGFRRGRIEQQRFLVQLGPPVGPDGGVGGVNGRL